MQRTRFTWLTVPGVVALPLFVAAAVWQRHHTAAVHHRPASPPPVLLADSTPWALGADARFPLARLSQPPLITWRPEAAHRLERVWRDLQFGGGGGVPASQAQSSGGSTHRCGRALYVHPYEYTVGITSQARDFSDTLIASVFTFRRTVVIAAPNATRDRARMHRNASAPDYRSHTWCAENTWLECFFERFSGSACARDVPLDGVPLVTGHNLSAISSAAPVLELARDSRYYPLLIDTTLFPHELWSYLVTANLVSLHDPASGAPVPFASMQTYARRMNAPRLYHQLALSALRSMLAGVVFRPTPRLAGAAGSVLARLRPQLQNAGPCLAVHFRWTDKAMDGGVAARMGQSAAHIPAAIERIRQRTGRRYSCFLVVSDDAEAAADALAAVLKRHHQQGKQLGGERGSGAGASSGVHDAVVVPVTRVKDLFLKGSGADYSQYRTWGHRYFLHRAVVTSAAAANGAAASNLTKVPAGPSTELMFGYYDSAVIDALVAAQASDYLIGVGSSGVSQLIAQWMGSARGADGNAFAVWQEDVAALGPVLVA